MAAIDILVAAKLLYDACKITQCEECPLSNMCNIGEVSGYIIGQPHE